MLPALLAEIGLPFLVKAVSSGLKALNNDTADVAANALDRANEQIANGGVSPEQINAANTHIEKMAQLESDENQTALKEINASLRTEAASEDWYVRRMRPTFGYIMAITWAAQMFALAFVIVADPAQAEDIIDSIDSLSTIWSVGLSVLGIYIYKRSQEKGAVSTKLKAPLKIKWND